MTTKLQNKVIEWNKEYYAKLAENKHGQRWINNRVNKVIEEMKMISEADKVTEVKIKVEWKKSRTWGYNPTATVEVFLQDSENGYSDRVEYIGSASGCGYDKESSAVGQAFNECKALLKLAYDKLEDDLKNKPYGLNDYESGISYGQGVGMSCYRNIAEYLGFEWSEEHGKSWDFYSMKLK